MLSDVQPNYCHNFHILAEICENHHIVGRIGEKMFTSGRKCNFFHIIAQYDANAGNPDRQHF